MRLLLPWYYYYTTSRSAKVEQHTEGKALGSPYVTSSTMLDTHKMSLLQKRIDLGHTFEAVRRFHRNAAKAARPAPRLSALAAAELEAIVAATDAARQAAVAISQQKHVVGAVAALRTWLRVLHPLLGGSACWSHGRRCGSRSGGRSGSCACAHPTLAFRGWQWQARPTLRRTRRSRGLARGTLVQQ